MKRIFSLKSISLMLVVLLAAMLVVPAALAFDGRGGDRVVIAAGEVIEDDLYVGGTEVIIDGTIKGDLIAAGRNVIINGTVEGDVLAGAQSVEINGTVTDDVRMAGFAMSLGSEAVVGGDVVAAGYSLETRPGSVIESKLIYGGGQALLAGEISSDLLASVAALEIDGRIGGNVKVQVDAPTDGDPMRFNPSTFSPELPTVPSIASGLEIGESAQIEGDLDYTSPQEFSLPVGQISGQVAFTLAQVDQALEDVRPEVRINPAVTWTLDTLRNIVALVVIALLLAWLAPSWFKRPAEQLSAAPLPSLGWGFVTAFVFPIAFLTLLGVVIMVAIFLAALTLGNLSGAVFSVGTVLLITLAVLASLIGTYLVKIVAGYFAGRWLLNRIKPSLAEHRVYPVLIGVFIIALVVAIPFVGWLFSLLITLFGLGALFLLTRDRLSGSRTPAAPAAVIAAE